MLKTLAVSLGLTLVVEVPLAAVLGLAPQGLAAGGAGERADEPRGGAAPYAFPGGMGEVPAGGCRRDGGRILL